MLAVVKTFSLLGLESFPVQAEIDISRGLPSFNIVGLPDAAVREAGDRVKAALRNSGFEFPVKKITVNLSPGDVKKEGPHFDLPIALGILAASEQVSPEALKGYSFAGELSLGGALCSIKGVLPMALQAGKMGLKGIFLPRDNAGEAYLAGELAVYPAGHIMDVVRTFQNSDFKPYNASNGEQEHWDSGSDFCHVKGQEGVKRAMEIAAAGGHNLLMVGPPGAGKTMLARCLPSILPKMNQKESLEVTKIYSIAGLLPEKGAMLSTRPFRSPHHSISHAALVGGGRFPKPGEVTLAHNGVLFMDEMPEFQKGALEVLRQPVEEGYVTISRSQGTVRFPASFSLIAAMNPCQCGGGHGWGQCSCTDGQIHRYKSRLSGPLMDRIDMFIQVSPLDYPTLKRYRDVESSNTIRLRVEEARRVQNERFSSYSFSCNARILPPQFKDFLALDRDGEALLEETFRKLCLSARSYYRILKLARTIADLDKKMCIEVHHVAEAVQYRADHIVAQH